MHRPSIYIKRSDATDLDHNPIEMASLFISSNTPSTTQPWGLNSTFPYSVHPSTSLVDMCLSPLYILATDKLKVLPLLLLSALLTFRLACSSGSRPVFFAFLARS